MTTTALDDLAIALQTTNDHAFRGLELTFKALTKQVHSLEAWVNGAGSDSGVGDGPIKEALKQFYRVPTVSGPPQARLLSFGCTVRIAQPEFTLLEDPERFSRFIAGIDEYRLMPKFYRRCYRGLLAAYFSYDPNGEDTPQAGTKNWSILRDYLGARLNVLEENGRIAWIPVIRNHGNLLSERPCDRYAPGLLKDEDNLFHDAKSGLEISDASWVIRRLVLAQIEVATNMPDEGFRATLAKLIALSCEYKFIKDEALALILNRYVKCHSAPIHGALRDLAVNSWGNPWLSHNSARWSRATDAAREMVTGWLKLKYIDLFFRLLTEDGTADLRRLKFWQSHYEKIDDMYFALGSHARLSQNTDFVELREKMSSRVLELSGGGSPENNAFIMHIGESVVVEFGTTGNACFVFDRARLPFRLSGVVRGDRTSLKHDDRQLWLPHVDRRRQTWEQQFESQIDDLRSSRIRGQRRTTLSGRDGTLQPASEYSRAGLNQFCGTRNLHVEDLTPRGGNLWVRVNSQDALVSKQLTDWGFQYKDGKGWWRA